VAEPAGIPFTCCPSAPSSPPHPPLAHLPSHLGGYRGGGSLGGRAEELRLCSGSAHTYRTLGLLMLRHSCGSRQPPLRPDLRAEPSAVVEKGSRGKPSRGRAAGSQRRRRPQRSAATAGTASFSQLSVGSVGERMVPLPAGSRPADDVESRDKGNLCNRSELPGDYAVPRYLEIWIRVFDAECSLEFAWLVGSIVSYVFSAL